MPNRWPISNGNWSDSAIWSGSLIPTASDLVFANNKIVTLDQDINVQGLSAASTAGVSSSGYFIATNGISIKADLTGSTLATTTVSVLPMVLSQGVTNINPTLLVQDSASINLTGSIIQGAAGSCITLIHKSTGTVNISGSTVDLGSTAGGTFNNGSILLYNGILNMIGNITVATTSQAPNVLNWYGTMNVIGNLQAIRFSPLVIRSCCIYNESGVINLTGNIIGNSTTQVVYGAHGIVNSAGIVNITGNLFSSSSTAPCVINGTNAGIINITGNVLGGVSSPAVSNGTTSGVISIIGQIQASTSSVGFASSATTATNLLSGPFINSGSRNAIYCYNVQLYNNISTRYTIVTSGSVNSTNLVSPEQITGIPSGSNVRAGILYGPGNELTGSMSVPHLNAVSYGVAVDNTTGTAIVKPEDVWNINIIELTSSNSIGQRLANTITTASMQGIVDAFN
jgi:hypothetical protein